MSSERSKAEAMPKDIPPHRMRIARQRLRWLQAIWDAESRSEGLARGPIVAAAVAQVKRNSPAAQFSAKTFYTWERLYRGFGLAGLVDGRGRPNRRALIERDRQPVPAERLSVREQLAEAHRLIGLALEQWNADPDKAAVATGGR